MIEKLPILSSVLKGRFSVLLFSFALMFFALPLIPAEQGLLDKSIQFFGLVVLLSCLRAITANRRFFFFMAALSLINVGVGGSELFGAAGSHGFHTLELVFRLIYYLLVLGSIMGYVLDSSPVTGDKISGSISAYILMGVIWSVVYSLFFHLQPRSFILPEQHPRMWSIYFSFTTLTTLGYGDITPQTPAAQSYAVMEAACGQVFLTVLVARLVALQIMRREG